MKQIKCVLMTLQMTPNTDISALCEYNRKTNNIKTVFCQTYQVLVYISKLVNTMLPFQK